MLELKQVTLLSIDVVKPRETLASMVRTITKVRFGDAVLLTDLSKWPTIFIEADPFGIRVVDHVQGNEAKTYHGISRKFFKDYEVAFMVEPAKHFSKVSTHLLCMEWDSGVMNPDAWNDSFLSYDYIGAPWRQHHDQGWPACDGVTNAVGNSGFSLRSQKFCSVVADIASKSNDPFRFSCDRWMCRSIRPQLDAKGIKFAPVNVASRFSCEDRPYDGAFGFHGKGTVDINRWGFWSGWLGEPAAKR